MTRHLYKLSIMSYNMVFNTSLNDKQIGLLLQRLFFPKYVLPLRVSTGNLFPGVKHSFRIIPGEVNTLLVGMNWVL